LLTSGRQELTNPAFSDNKVIPMTKPDLTSDPAKSPNTYLARFGHQIRGDDAKTFMDRSAVPPRERLAGGI
jgi:hypothetical protein